MITGWESPDVLYASLAERLGSYADRFEAEQVTVTDADGGVTVVIGLTGFLSGVDIDPQLRNRCPARALAGLVVAAISKAERAARERRDEVTAQLGAELGV